MSGWVALWFEVVDVYGCMIDGLIVEVCSTCDNMAIEIRMSCVTAV
jgi:hypothetical protein